MEQKRYEDTPTEEGALSGGGELCSLPRRLPFLEAGRQKESAVYTDQAARSCPAAATLAFLVMLQEEEKASSVRQQVLIYRTLQALLQHGLEVEPTRDLIVAASKQLGPLLAQEGPRELQAAASHTLATLAHGHFNPVMTELQRHLRPFRLPSEFALLTLGRLAAANVYGSIPFFGITLATLQTVVRWILDGRRRRALCTALEQMCRAIQVYLRNWGKCSYPRISVQRFAGHLFPLYAPMARTWLPGGDPQVQAAVLKVLSPVLSILLSRREFQAQVHEDLLLLSALYESRVDPLLLLSQILEASLVNRHPIPKMLVDPLARALSHQICPRGREQPHHQENCAEISRLFLYLARSRPSELLGALQRQLEEGCEGARVTLLLLLSKVAGAQAPEVWSRRQLCVKAVKAVLRDDSARVRLATLQVIGKLLHVGYLEKVEGWPLHYIALQLAVSSHQLTHPTRRLPLGGLEEKAIERAAMEALHAPPWQPRRELWARLLSYLMRPHCATSTVPLCHALRLLAKQRLRRAAHKEGGLDPGDTPTPQEVLARLLSLAVSPLEGPGRGAAALLLLEALRPELYQEVAEHCKYTLEEAVWQEKLLEFLRKSLQQQQQQQQKQPPPPPPRGGREEGGGWILGLAQEFAKQLHLTQGSSIEKVFLHKALGMALSWAGEAQGVTCQLREVLLQADHTEESQQEGGTVLSLSPPPPPPPPPQGLRWCLAYCAEGQLPAVLAALSHFEEQAVPGEEELDAETGCLHSGQGLPERARLRSALLLLYSSTVLRAPWEQLRPHLGGRIVPGILRHYAASPGPQRAKDTELVLSFTQSVSELSLSIQGHGETPDFRLPQKQALLGHLVDILKAQSSEEASGSPVCREVLAALWHLSQVPEPLPHEESVELAERCLNHVLALPPSGLSGDATQGLPTKTVAAVSRLVEALLGEPVAEWCQQAFQLLGYWLVSEREGQRARAMQVAAHLLKARLQRSSVGRDAISPPLPLGQFGHFLGTLGPSTHDALGTIRKGAGQCIEALLSIPGTARRPTPEGRAKEWRLQCIQRGLRSESAGEVHLASLRMAKLVARALPSEEILPFLRSLLEQLRTLSAACDQAALSWFEVAAGERRADLKDKWAEDPSLRRSLAQALCGLARHHHRAVCDSLVEQPLLQPRARRELWGALATPENSQASVLKHLLRWVKADVDGAPHSVSVLIALQEVVSALGDCARLFPLFAELCHALLRRLSQDWPGEMPAAVSPLLGSHGELGTGQAGPRGLAVAVLRSVLSRALPEAAQEMEAEKAWTALEEPQSLLKGVASLGRALAHADNPLLERLLRRLLRALRSKGGPSHGLALAFCVELVGHPSLLHQPETLGHLLSSWLAAAREGDGPLRFLSVRGLGNLAEGAPQEAQKHPEALLGTLLQGLGSPARPEVALESLRALGKAWGCLRAWHARRTLQAVSRQLCDYLGHVSVGEPRRGGGLSLRPPFCSKEPNPPLLRRRTPQPRCSWGRRLPPIQWPCPPPAGGLCTLPSFLCGFCPLEGHQGLCGLEHSRCFGFSRKGSPPPSLPFPPAGGRFPPGCGLRAPREAGWGHPAQPRHDLRQGNPSPLGGSLAPLLGSQPRRGPGLLHHLPPVRPFLGPAGPRAGDGGPAAAADGPL
ncbi:hypothetical protein JRQ81_008235 [Phrynocephalus forsythii]|uniref:Uncharacterized protein n=1 Tax=Phrynocephalus forsythii TaxID=171643 RepID=A0A9Q0XC11_9SAUR|nr:hypothetical protein JRQ81_008235 [Phrynocephalus forsythii]